MKKFFLSMVLCGAASVVATPHKLGDRIGSYELLTILVITGAKACTQKSTARWACLDLQADEKDGNVRVYTQGENEQGFLHVHLMQDGDTVRGQLLISGADGVRLRSGRQYVLSPDGKWAAHYDADNSIGFFCPDSTDNYVQKVPGTTCFFSPQGNRVAVRDVQKSHLVSVYELHGELWVLIGSCLPESSARFCAKGCSILWDFWGVGRAYQIHDGLLVSAHEGPLEHKCSGNHFMEFNATQGQLIRIDNRGKEREVITHGMTPQAFKGMCTNERNQLRMPRYASGDGRIDHRLYKYAEQAEQKAYFENGKGLVALVDEQWHVWVKQAEL